MTPNIRDLDWHIERAEFQMKIGQPLETAYPKLQKCTFVNSADDLKHGMNWMWLQSQKTTPFSKTSAVLADIVRRSLPFYGVVTRELFRDKNDYYLMSAAILTGDRDALAKATEIVKEAEVGAESPNYFRSLAGILKFKLKGDSKRAEQQFEIFCSCKGKLTGLNVAKKTFLKAFIADDVKALQRQIKGVAATYWKRIEVSEKSTVQNRAGDITLGMVWDTNNFWPWPEAVLLRLMARRGIEFETDEFWLPKILIKGAA
jgi:hypothetical protein